MSVCEKLLVLLHGPRVKRGDVRGMRDEKLRVLLGEIHAPRRLRAGPYRIAVQNEQPDRVGQFATNPLNALRSVSGPRDPRFIEDAEGGEC